MRLDLMKLCSTTPRSARHVDNVSLSLSSTISLFPAVSPSCVVTEKGRDVGRPYGRGGAAESNAERPASSLFTLRAELNARIGRVRRRSRTKPGPYVTLHRAGALDSEQCGVRACPAYSLGTLRGSTTHPRNSHPLLVTHPFVSTNHPSMESTYSEDRSRTLNVHFSPCPPT